MIHQTLLWEPRDLYVSVAISSSVASWKGGRRSHAKRGGRFLWRETRQTSRDLFFYLHTKSTRTSSSSSSWRETWTEFYVTSPSNHVLKEISWKENIEEKRVKREGRRRKLCCVKSLLCVCLFSSRESWLSWPEHYVHYFNILSIFSFFYPSSPSYSFDSQKPKLLKFSRDYCWENNAILFLHCYILLLLKEAFLVPESNDTTESVQENVQVVSLL